MRWLTAPQIEHIHGLVLGETPGAAGSVRRALLESAAMRPQNAFHYAPAPPSPPQLAAEYAYGIVRNHPFTDGNKRTAAVAAETFLNINDLQSPASDAILFDAVVDLAAGRIGTDEYAEALMNAPDN